MVAHNPGRGAHRPQPQVGNERGRVRAGGRAPLVSHRHPRPEQGPRCVRATQVPAVHPVWWSHGIYIATNELTQILQALKITNRFHNFAFVLLKIVELKILWVIILLRVNAFIDNYMYIVVTLIIYTVTINKTIDYSFTIANRILLVRFPKCSEVSKLLKL